MSELPLLRHLQACPEVFFRPPDCAPEVWRLVGLALIDQLWERVQPGEPCPLPALSTDPVVCDWIGPLCWLLSGVAPLFGPLSGPRCLAALTALSDRMAPLFAPRALCFEAERAEECLRLLLAQLDEPVPGETRMQSAARLADISSARRQALWQARERHQQRQQAIQQARARLARIDSGD